MHRHTTNSISTASAVFLALKKKPISRREVQGAKWGLQYQLPLMGERGSRRTPPFLNSLAFFFISAQYGFILWGDKAIWWGGILHNWAGAVQDWQTIQSRIRATFIFFFWFPFFCPFWAVLDSATVFCSLGALSLFPCGSGSLWMKHWFT